MRGGGAAVAAVSLAAWLGLWHGDPSLWLVSQYIIAVWPGPEAPGFAVAWERRVLERWGSDLAEGRTDGVDEVDLTEEEEKEVVVDLSRPFVVRDALAASNRWGFDWASASPRGDVVIDYFSDASTGALTPDARAPLRDVLAAIRAGGSRAKTGTELVFRTYPTDVADLPLATWSRVFRWDFAPERIGTWLTVPLFAASGVLLNDKNATHNWTEMTQVRTEMHCEPIANVAVQLVGAKRWTLVSPAQSVHLGPTVARDGRGYVYAARHDRRGVAALSVVQRAGDLLYVPTMWWHQVYYEPGIASLSVSLFHVRLRELVTQNPLLAAALLPNLLKELVGWKTQ